MENKTISKLQSKAVKQKPKELDWVERMENILGNREDLIKQLVGKIPEDKIIEGLKYFDETRRQLTELFSKTLQQQREEDIKNICKGVDKIINDNVVPEIGSINYPRIILMLDKYLQSLKQENK